MVNTVLPYNNRSHADFYPSIRLLLTFSKYLLTLPVHLDRERNLKINYLNLLFYLVFHGYIIRDTMAFSIVGILFLIENAYSAGVLSVIELVFLIYDGLYNVIAVIQLLMKIPAVSNVFQQLKILDDKVKLSKKREEDFRHATKSCIALLFVFPIFQKNAVWITNRYRAHTRLFYIANFYVFVAVFAAKTMPIILLQLILLLCTYYLDYINCELKHIVQSTAVTSHIYTLEGLSNEYGNIRAGERIKHIRSLLAEVDCLKDKANRAFGIMVTGNYLFLYYQAVLIIHLMALPLMRGGVYMYEVVLRGFIYLCTALVLMYVPLFGLLKSCSAFAAEGQKLAEVVHELLAENLHDSVKKELTIFSLTLLHREKDVVTYGLFRLNNRLWATLFSGVSVGAIALIQLDYFSAQKDSDPIDEAMMYFR